MSNSLNIVNAAQVAVVADGGAPRSGAEQGRLDLIADGTVIIRDGKISAVGPASEMESWLRDDVSTINAAGKTVIPGLIESHSHPLFANDRYDEFSKRLAGVQESANAGNGKPSGEVSTTKMKAGFWFNAEATKNAPDSLLIERLAKVYDRILRGGVTTLEVKSGYGLSVDEELRELRLLADSRQYTPIELVLTFLGAHVEPQGMTADEYTDLIINDMLPAVLEQGLAEFHDITCEEHYFTPEQATRLLQVSQKIGIPTRVHADGWRPSGGWPVAVSGGAVAADHLTFTTDEEINEVGQADTIAVLLPAAELTYMTRKRANARLFIENNVPVAIATDYCSAIHATSLINSVAMACPWFGMTPAESFVGATLNAAYVLGRNQDRGSLDVGKRGDVVVLDAPHPDAACHALGAPIIDTVIIGGEVVLQKCNNK